MTLPLLTASWRVLYDRHEAGEHVAVPVRISVGTPRFWPLAKHAPYVRELAPLGLLRKPPLARHEFDRLYLERLDEIGAERIAARLEAIHAEYVKPIAVACFEADRADCHRGTFAAWWYERTGQEVPEL